MDWSCFRSKANLEMARFIVRRFFSTIGTLFGVSLVIFMMMVIIPGDAVQAMLGPAAANQEVVAEMRKMLGLDQPLYQQYLMWLGRAITGDFGPSVALRIPVSSVLFPKLANTIILTAAAVGIAAGAGVTFGILASRRPNGLFDRCLMLGSLLFASAPPFLLGLVLMFLVALKLRWLPAGGMYSPVGERTTLDLVRHLVLPALTASSISLAVIARLTRGALVEEMTSVPIHAGRARGLSEKRLLLIHGMRNVLPTLVNIIGLQIGFIFGGGLFAEVIFQWPGVGSQMYASILARDIPMVQGAVLAVAVVFVAANGISDIASQLLNTRGRVNRGAEASLWGGL